MARHSQPFVFESTAVETERTVLTPHRFVDRVVQAIARRSLVFRQHDHRRVALIVRLEKANLQMYDLAGKNLSGFSMRRVNLVRAHLESADLTGAKLFRASLEGADFTDARLVRTDLREADLGAATLFRADLRGALLQGANLRYADLRGARLGSVDFSGADLRDARFSPNFDRNDVVSDDATQWPDAECVEP